MTGATLLTRSMTYNLRKQPDGQIEQIMSFREYFRFLLQYCQQFSISPNFFGGKKLQLKNYLNLGLTKTQVSSILQSMLNSENIFIQCSSFFLLKIKQFSAALLQIKSKLPLNENCLSIGVTGFQISSSCFNIILQQYQRKKIMDKAEKNDGNFIEMEGSEASDSTGYRYLDNKEIDKLYASYNLMKRFSESLPTELDFSLCQILENYAERHLSFELLPKNVMHILDKRIQRMLKNKKLKKNWSGQDTQILYWTFSHYCHIHRIASVEQTTKDDWENISKLIPGSNSDSCMFKILSLKKIKLADQKWTQYENGLLLQIAIKYTQKNWRHIAQQLYKKNQIPQKIFRNAKQCKQHWVCYLNPQLKKGSWSLQQDKKLISFIVANKGYRKWAQISKIFGGRTQNALKNRFTLIIQRLRRQRNSLNDLDLLKLYLEQLEQRSQTLKSNNTSDLKKCFQYIKIKKEQKPVKSLQIQKVPKTAQSDKESTKQQINFVPLQQNIQLMPILPQYNRNNLFRLSGQNIDINQTQCFPMYFNNQYFWVYPAYNTNSQ